MENSHQRNKRKIKIIGTVLTVIGAILAVVGFVSFGLSVNSFEPPKFFFLAMIGLPCLFIGISLLVFGFKKEITQYTVNESQPLFDTIAKQSGNVANSVQNGINSVKCSCGTFNDKGSKFCKNCGKPLTKTCPVCNAENDGDSKFCDSCGHKFEDEN